MCSSSKVHRKKKGLMARETTQLGFRSAACFMVAGMLGAFYSESIYLHTLHPLTPDHSVISIRHIYNTSLWLLTF